MTVTDPATAKPRVPTLSDAQWEDLLRARATDPEAVDRAYAARRRRGRLLSERGTIFLVAADHPARGALRSGGDAIAMADRRSLLARLLEALEHPDVDGVLGSPDIVEELLLLGALDDKVVIGSMNRGGLDGATWTMDDRFTGYDAKSIADKRLEGGKMLVRIDDRDASVADTLEGCARAVTELAGRGLMAMVEPLPYHREEDGCPRATTPRGSSTPPLFPVSSSGVCQALTPHRTSSPGGGHSGNRPFAASWSVVPCSTHRTETFAVRLPLPPPCCGQPFRGRSVRLHRPLNQVDEGTLVHLSPEDAGWERTGIKVLALAAGTRTTVHTGPAEAFVLPLTGSLSVDVTDDADRPLGSYALRGRDSVFTAVTDFAYVGRDSTVVLTSDGGAEVALPSSRCTQVLPPAYGAAENVPVEVRGAGNATRQVTNFGVPGVWDHAKKLICCELITPPGNWSSYPPHKHDATAPCPVVNEEIYYYRIAGEDQVTPSRTGFGYHRTYTGPEHRRAGLAALDVLVEVRDHDVVLVPHGYHGPCIAAPGYPMYYLNVMAGPADDRTLAFCDDPDHTWVRGSWAEMESDPRCPATSASGRTPR